MNGYSLHIISLLLALLSLFSCQEKKGRSILISPQAQMDSVTPALLNTPPIIGKTHLAHTIDSFFTSITRDNQFNGVVLAIDNGEVVFRRAFGYSNFQTRDSLNANSLFQLASVSKQFTAISVLQLYETGKIRLEDPVTRFFPDFPYPSITIRLLLSHRSGLPNYVNFTEEHYATKGSTLTNEKLIRLLAEVKPDLKFEPDVKFNYCNTNYCVLAAIVEKVAGVSFEEYVTTNLLRKAGLQHSFIASPKTAEQRKLLVTGYDENNQISKPDYMDGLMGDKGVYSSAMDMKRWDDALYNGTVLKTSTLNMAMKPANPDMIAGRNYGFGWRIKSLSDGTPLYYHGGWWKGFNTYSMRNPATRSAVIILSNRVNGSFNNINSLLPVLYHQKRDSDQESI